VAGLLAELNRTSAWLGAAGVLNVLGYFLNDDKGEYWVVGNVFLIAAIFRAAQERRT